MARDNLSARGLGHERAKMVEFHHRKRNLASSWLDDTDISGRISTDELWLIREEECDY